MYQRIVLNIVFITILLQFTGKAAAQDTARQKGLIYHKAFAGYQQDGKRLNADQLKAEIYKVPAAIHYYEKSKTNKIAGYSFYVPMLVFFLLGKQNRDIASTGFGKNKIGFNIAGLISGATSIYFTLRSHKQWKKAIRMYNDNRPPLY